MLMMLLIGIWSEGANGALYDVCNNIQDSKRFTSYWQEIDKAILRYISYGFFSPKPLVWIAGVIGCWGERVTIMIMCGGEGRI